MKKRIVWGTCWFNETIDTLINFYHSSIDSLTAMNFEVVPIIFDAKYIHNKTDIEYIKKKLKDVIIIENNTNIFPNKNYGVSLITRLSYNLNCEYTAIVDSDWNIKENYSFIQNIFLTLINNNADIVIPDIGNASGRSNILIGKTVVNLFYPEYKEILKTVFPGSVIARTPSLYKIVSNKLYHYDWGGEWDVISIAISQQMKICSSFVDVENMRHRPNNSKIFDSFQIWRAIFNNEEIIDRAKYLKSYNKTVTSYNKLSKKVLEKDYSICDLINIFEKYNITDTERQILYMILYPIAFLSGEIIEMPIIDIKNKAPYEKKELNKISDFAIYCAQMALKNCDINKLFNNAKSLNGKYLSDWNQKNQGVQLII